MPDTLSAPAPLLAALLYLAACTPPAGPAENADSAVPPESTEPAGDADRGRQLLANYHCGRCHTIPGVAAARGQIAVTLAAVGQRSYIAGRIPNEPAAMQRWLIDPPAMVPGTLMPNLGVSADDARDMAAYLSGIE